MLLMGCTGMRTCQTTGQNRKMRGIACLLLVDWPAPDQTLCHADMLHVLHTMHTNGMHTNAHQWDAHQWNAHQWNAMSRRHATRHAHNAHQWNAPLSRVINFWRTWSGDISNTPQYLSRDPRSGRIGVVATTQTQFLSTSNIPLHFWNSVHFEA